MSEEKKPELEKESIIGDVIDRLKPWLPGQPSEVIVTPAPVNPPASPLGPLLRHALSIALAVILSFIAARWGVTPAPLPSLQSQSQPQVVILSVPAGATIAEAKK
jgi:hypothetical protein